MLPALPFPAVNKGRLLASFGAAVALASGSLPFWEGESLSPREALLKSFQEHRRQPLEMVQLQQPFFEDNPVVVKVLVDRRRRMRVDVLRPLNHEGVASVDDGRELRIFYPDKNEVWVQRSPMLFLAKPEDRVKLIERNYALDLDRGPKVAGRPTWALHFAPRNAGISERLILLDTEFMFPLRMESRSSGGSRILTDTLHIKFELGKPEPSFALPSPKEARVVRRWGPIEAARTPQEAERLGFSLRSPSRLPYGFAVQSVQLMGEESRPFLGIRVTDGLLSSTVYMWSLERHGSKNPVGRDPIYRRDGVAYAVYGEAPQNLARTLLSTFVLAQR